MNKVLILTFGAIETLIGVLQCYRVLRESVLVEGLSVEKGILMAAGFLSFFLGLGLLLRKSLAVKVLIFFASGIAFSKLLIMAGVFTLPEVSEILFPKHVENVVSLGYHLILSVFLLNTVKHQP